MRSTVTERLWSKVDKSGDCWNWTASGNGYGQLWVGGRMRPAHRMTYELLIGPIPEGLELDHLCRNTWCVNPAHLEPVTHAENMRRDRVRITACPKGHPYTPDNVKVVHGRRNCRQCYRADKYAHRRAVGRGAA